MAKKFKRSTMEHPKYYLVVLDVDERIDTMIFGRKDIIKYLNEYEDDTKETTGEV